MPRRKYTPFLRLQYSYKGPRQSAWRKYQLSMRAKRTHAAAAGIITGAVKSVFGNDDGDIDIGERAGDREGTCVVASVGHAYFHRRRRARCLSSFALHTHATRSLATLSLRSNTHLCTCVLIYFGGRARARGETSNKRRGREGATQTTDCTAHQYLLFVDAEAVIKHCSHRNSFSPSFHFFHSLFFSAGA